MKRFVCPVFAAATLPAWSASASEFDCLIDRLHQIPAGTRYSVRFD